VRQPKDFLGWHGTVPAGKFDDFCYFHGKRPHRPFSQVSQLSRSASGSGQQVVPISQLSQSAGRHSEQTSRTAMVAAELMVRPPTRVRQQNEQIYPRCLVYPSNILE
jgi:hypothetical protein